MDEPTAVLAPQEIDDLFRTLRSMTADGRSVVFISHKLGEVMAIADRITVMRRGMVTAAGIAAGGDVAGRPRAADGRPRGPRGARADAVRARRRSSSPVRDVSADNDRGLPALRGVSLDVRAGEIVGIAAVAGNGQSELAEVITGLRPARGSVTIGGTEVANRPGRHGHPRGLAHVPEDRTGVGTRPEPVGRRQPDHEALPRRGRSRVAGSSTTPRRAASPRASRSRTRSRRRRSTREARLLSGGNIQRLIFAREIDTGPRVMVAVQPTRGLDVGAIEAVHRVLLERRKAGTAILLDLRGPRRDPRPGRSGRRHVRGPDRRLVPGRRGRHRDARAADDRRHGRAGPSGGGRAGPTGRHAGRDRSRTVNLRLEPRTDAPRWFSGVMTLAALVFALLLSGFIIWLVGGDPFASFAHIVSAAFGSVGVISDTLVKATPLILTGLACSLAFRMHLWNIGAEGQFLLGAWGASAVVLFPLLPAGTPAIVVIPVMMLAGAAGRRAVGLHPRDPAGAAGRQRDHHDADAQLRGPALGPVLGLRAVEQGRLPGDQGRSRPRPCSRA